MITVLVVEDEIYARQSLIKQIREYDVQKKFKILEAENGLSALNIAKKEKPELVLTDIRMPFMDGIELLKQLKEQYNSVQVIMLSAYSEFEYARKAVMYGAFGYIVKPIEDQELKECLDKFLHKDMSQKRNHIISGQDIVTRFIIQKIENEMYHDFIGENMFKKIFKKYQILMLSFSKNINREAEDIFKDIEYIFQQEMWTGFRMFQKEKKNWILVINVEQDRFFFHRKLSRFFEKKNIDIRIGISNERVKIEELVQAVREAKEALTFKLFLPDKILMYSQICKKKVESYRIGKNEETVLRQALKNRSRKKTEEILNEIFAEMNEKSLIQLESLELFFNQMMVIMQEACLGDNLWFQENYTGILDFNSLDEMQKYILKIGIDISNTISKEKQNKSGDAIEEIINYVSQYYDRDITLKEIAEKHLYMNPTYVSHCFVERMGISFSAWLRGVRIGQARRMLENSEASITEVAFMAGYNDTSQFIRAFKQETGITPKKYRDMLWKKEEFK